jgi:hypothetical protein
MAKKPANPTSIEDLIKLAILARITVRYGKSLGRIESQQVFNTIASVIDSCDVCFGVWRDLKQPHGVGIHVIKGGDSLREMATDTSGGRAPLSLRVVPCLSKAHAIAAHKAWGRPD